MHSSVARSLLIAALLLALAVAVVLTAISDSEMLALLGWLLVSVLFASGVVAWIHQRESNRLRRSLAMGLAHHLRTSLSHIQAFNEMLLLGSESSEEQRHEWLEVVGREAQRLGSSVENLLFVMQDREGREFPARRVVDLGLLLEDVACDHATLSNRPVDLDIAPGPDIVVVADPAALRHALGNLIDGATRTAREGSTISATAAADGSTASVVVLFDPVESAFGRGRWRLRDERLLHGATAEGLGLEFAVARQVARQHGGRAAWIHRLDHIGFRVELPLAIQ
ncbi:MAG: hypothetical protein GEU90_05325 [Gemmatimonas sp.]|nr:hypothetical protein [Gemmatimonas sp.]